MVGAQSLLVRSQAIAARDRAAGRARASFGQLRLWFLQQLDPHSTAYNLHIARRFRGPLQVDALERALNEILRRHEALRTTFEVDGSEPVQVIAPFAPRRLNVVDMSTIPETAQWDEIRRWSNAEAQRPFDLARGPLFRPSLIRASDTDAVLLCVMHHIVADGWSLQRVLFRELAAIYRAFLTGSAPEGALPPLRIQYADFAEWQRDQLAATQPQLEYWLRELHDLAPLDLPTAGPRPPAPSFRVRRVPFTLSPQLARGLEDLSRRESVTLFMTLLAAFQLLLHRYTGQTDVAVGCPIAERHRAELEPIIGFLVNTIIIRSQATGDLTFVEHLRRVRQVTINALDNRDVPFDRLVGVLAPDRDPSRHPLVQVLFQLQEFPSQEQPSSLDPAGALTIEPVKVVDQGASGFDLVLNTMRGADGIRGTLLYATDLFDESAATRLIDHYIHVLDAVAADPAQRIGDVSLASTAETRLLLVDVDKRRRALYPAHTLHALFEEQVDRRGDAVAVTFGETALSYRALDACANRIAHGLRAHGTAPGGRVAVLLAGGPELVATLVGVLKASATFVCLDPRYPTGRLAQILDEAAPDVMLADLASLRAHAELIGRARGRVIVIDLDDDAAAAAGLPATCLGAGGFAAFPASRLPPVDPAFPAFIVYTSGSTGRPKGIVQSQRSFSQFVRAQAAAFALGSGHRFAQWASCGYDASYCEIFGALCVGATLCMAEPAVRFDSAPLVAWIRSSRISHLQVVPSLARQLVQALDASPPHDLPSLEHLFLAGEVLPLELAAAWLRRFPQAPRLYNVYGPSETVLATCYRVTDIGDRPPAVGSPMDGRHVLVLDGRGNLSPLGVDGDIYVRSPFLADGYLGQPAETARAFVPDPFSRDGARLYHTGDRGRWRGEGMLQFLGRRDHQVKLRGNRVELREVEAAIAGTAGVAEAAVAVHEYGPGDERLVAYVTFREQDSPPEDGAPAPDSRHVDDCRALYNEIYSLPNSYSRVDALINTRSWTSSYTNGPLPEGEVRESIDDAAERIRALSPARVLEIGAGTGLLTRRLAPACAAYCATDISDAAVAFLQQEFADETTRCADFRLLRRAAHELDAFGDGSFDAVVMNLVTQHFPDRAYLERVLGEALRVTARGGFVFVGGVRHLGLLPACHASVQFARAHDSLTHAQFRQQTGACLESEKDLAIAPLYFTHFLQRSGRAGHVRVLPKRGRAPNEITRFQYDAVLHLDAVDLAPAELPWQDWTASGMTVPQLRLELLVEMPEVIALAGVPNARLREALAVTRWMREGGAAATVGGMRQVLRALPRGTAVDPADLWKLAEDLAYDVEVLWTRDLPDGAFDVVLHRPGPARGRAPALYRCPETPHAETPIYTNQPLDALAAAARVGALADALRRRLPEHMVPSDVVVLPRLPRTATGKLDRKALVRPEGRSRAGDLATVDPRTPVERQLLGIWREVLKIDRIGVHDHFFDLGGHSLLATQLMNRVRALFALEIPLRRFLESPTIADLAQLVSSSAPGRAARLQACPAEAEAAVPTLQGAPTWTA